MIKSAAVRAFYRATALPFGLTAFSEKWLELTALRALLKGIDTVLDVGANVGQFALKLRRLGYRGRIVSFEPDPRSYPRLVEAMRHDSRWTGVPLALGEGECDAPLQLARSSVVTSFLTPIDRDWVDHAVSVHVRRLDAIWAELFPTPPGRVLLKTDTQGYDLNVFRGGTGILPHVHAVLAELSVVPIYEHAPTITESLAEYERAGFLLHDLAVVNRTPDGAILEYDGLFVRHAR